MCLLHVGKFSFICPKPSIHLSKHTHLSKFSIHLSKEIIRMLKHRPHLFPFILISLAISGFGQPSPSLQKRISQAIAAAANNSHPDYTAFVNPFIGTGKHSPLYSIYFFLSVLADNFGDVWYVNCSSCSFVTYLSSLPALGLQYLSAWCENLYPLSPIFLME